MRYRRKRRFGPRRSFRSYRRRRSPGRRRVRAIRIGYRF